MTLAYGAYWPSYQEIENSIQVRFVAGYGDFASAVPRPIAQAMLLMIGGWYEDRSSGQAPVAAQHCAQDCIQVHGGMGFTWEVDAHLYLKRAFVLDTVFGSGDHHAEAMAALV